jgi:hypothetical protein
MARDFNDVIDQLLAVIPETETDLLNKINDYKNGLFNIAPELRGNGEYFIRLTYILNSNITEIDTEWKHQLIDIFNDKKSCIAESSSSKEEQLIIPVALATSVEIPMAVAFAIPDSK